MTVSGARAMPAVAPPPAARGLYLHPGHLVVADNSAAVTTILGSCVSLCLHDVRRGVGGINHFLLPGGGADASPAQAARYGDVACARLLESLVHGGSRAGDLSAKVFGGARVLSAFGGEDHLGMRNAAVALAFLDAHGIPLGSCDVGGIRGRKLIFHTDTGDAFVRSL